VVKRKETVRFEVSLQELSLLDGLLKDSLFPEVIRSRSTKYEHAPEAGEKPFFYLAYDQLCQDSAADSSLTLLMQPLVVVLNHQAARLLKDFFVGGRNAELIEGLSGIAGDQLTELRLWTRSSLEEAFRNHKAIDLHLEVDAPILVVPKDCTDAREFLFVADLGHVRVQSRLVSSEQRAAFLRRQATESLSRVDLHGMKELLYDQFEIALSQVQINFFAQLAGWTLINNDEAEGEGGIPPHCRVIERINLSLDIGSCILPSNAELPSVVVKGRVPSIGVHFSDEKYNRFMDLVDIFFPPKSPEAEAELLERTPASAFYVQQNISSIISLPNAAFRPAAEISRSKEEEEEESADDAEEGEEEEEEEFQDAVESLEDLKILERPAHDRVSVELTFVVEQARGHVVDHRAGDKDVGELVVENVRVIIEVHPSDISVRVLLKAFDVIDYLEGPARQLVEGSGEEEGLLRVSVSLVDVDHPLFHSKYKSAGIFVDVGISAVSLMLCPPAIMSILRYVADTFSRAQHRPAPARTRSLQRSASAVERRVSKLARAASTASKLAKPEASLQAGPLEADLSKIVVNVRLSLLRVHFGEQARSVGTLNLQRAALCISLFGTGKLLMQGKLASLSVVPQAGLSEVYAALDGIPFLRVEGASVVDFSYETFLRGEPGFPGHDVGLALRSGSMHFCYLPAFLLRLVAFGTDLRRAASELLLGARGSGADRPAVHDANREASRFHYCVDIDSPRIDLCSPRSPGERVSLFPGNLSIANSFAEDSEAPGLFDTLIDIAVRSVHVDIAHCPDARGARIIEGSLIESVDVDVRVLQAHDALARGKAPLEVDVASGPVRIAAAETEYTLFMGILNWFVATNPAVIGALNEFLAAGAPSAAPPSPLPEEEGSLDRSVMAVHVLADLIQANIFRYTPAKPGPEADPPSAVQPISLLQFSAFTLDYAAKGSGDYAVEMAVREAALHDTRAGPGRAFRQVLRRTDERGGGARAGPAPMITLSYDYVKGAGQTVTKVSLDSPQLLLVLEHLFALKDYFVGGAPKAPLIVLPDAGSSSGIEAGKAAQGQQQQQAYSFTLQATGASVLVLENPGNPLSEAMELGLPQLVFTDSTGFQTVTVHEARGAFCNMNDIRGTRLSFLEPLDVIGATEKEGGAAGGVPSSRMTLSVTPVVFRLAYQDIAVFTSLYRQYASLSRPAEPAEPEPEAPEDTEAAFRRLSRGPSLESLSLPAGPPAELRVSLNIDSIRAVFVDDFSKTNRPLIEVLLDAPHGDYNMLAGCTTGQFRGRLSSTYFNLTNSHWEPLVEPVPLALDLVQDPPQEGAGRGPAVLGSSLLVSSGEGLEVVVSHAFAELLLRLSASLAASGGELALSALRESSQAYLVVNETGSPMTIWASRSRRRRQSSAAAAAAGEAGDAEELGRTTVAPGGAVPWGYEDWRSLRSSRDSLDVRVSCRLEESPWEVVRGIAVDRVGSAVYSLRPRVEGCACRLVVQVDVPEADAAGGVKRIRFRPPIAFANDTKYPLEVQLLGGEGDGFGEAPIARIEPGRSGSFPLALVRPGMRVRGRPCGLGYGWSDGAIPVDANLLPRAKRKGMPPVQMACSHRTDPVLHPAFHFTLFASEEGKAPSPARTPSLSPEAVVTVHFRAPFQLMNQLPLAISYRIYDKTAGFDFGGALVAGDTAQLHFVSAAHVIGLALQVDEAGLGSSQISLVNTPEDWGAEGGGGGGERDDRLPCVDSERLRMDLRLAYQLKKQVIRRVILWSPYVIYSLFGRVPLSLRNNTVVRANRGVPGVTRMNEANGAAEGAGATPLLFAYPESMALRERVRIRLGDSEWSRPLSMETVGAVDCVDLHDAAADAWHNVGMSVRLGPAKYQPTKVVHLGPRYIFCNQTAGLHLGIGFDRLERCAPGQRVPFGVAPQHRRLTAIGVLAEDADTLRTAPFDVDEMGKVYLKTGGTGLLRVDRILQGAFVFVLAREETVWPYELVNNSSMDLLYSQSTACSVLPPESLLAPGQSAPFAWDEPSAPDKKLVVRAGSKRLPVDIHDIGQLQPVSVRFPGGLKKSLAIDVLADGPALRVVFSDFDRAAGRSIYKLRRASRKSLGPGLGQAAPQDEDAFEVASVESVVSAQFRLQLPSVGVTLINRQLEEVVYVFAKDVELRHAISNLHATYGLTLGWLQIDNQLFGDWDHPILLYPAVITKRHRGTEDSPPPPFLSAALIMSQDAAHGVTYIKYFGFLMQEVQVDLGEHLVNKLVEFGQFESIASADPRDSTLDVPEDRRIPPLTSLDSQSSLLYFELLQLHPMKVNLSFSKSEGPQYSETEDALEAREGSYNPFTAVATVLTTALGSISDAPLRFNALILEHPIIRRNVLLSLVASHYSQQAVSQVHRIVGAADFIGNPVGLFSSFGSGVSDFFYEPFLGLVSDRPGDMGIGLAKGSISLVRKTVYGLTDTFSKFTGSMSKGLSLLCICAHI
jgi:vacuolar protein sorting-associated protein 13A/C